MTKRSSILSRRTFLGGGTAIAIALPMLEAMLPTRSARAHGPGDPQRLLTFYVPCGINMSDWTPAETGAGWGVTPILQPLADAGLLDDITLLTGLDNRPGDSDGAGDHAAGTGSFATCVHVNKSESEITNGTSLDQVYAEYIGKQTAVRSMQLGMDGGGNVGNCDSGYGCAYIRNISWQGNTPLSKLTEPQTAFDLLFSGFDPGASAAELQRIKAKRLSVLDHALDDAEALRAKLGASDRVKMEQYLDSVRDLELRVQAEPDAPACELDPGFPGDAGSAIDDRVKVMLDIVIKAFQCDRTRTISFMLANGASGRDYGFIGAPGGHHNLSHHGGDQNTMDMLSIIDRWEVEKLAYLLSGLKNSPEGEGSNVLENSMVFFSSEIEDGNSHAHTNMPVLVGGHGGGTMPVGQHLRFEGDPLANLFIDMLQKLGVDISTFGDDGTGPLGI
jgi:hypothetical protein